MGKVRTKTVKKSARVLVEKYYSRLGNDFQVNKKLAAEVAVFPSKRMRNKVAGYVTKLMKRIARSGTVRGISLKLQEEERERRLDFVPEVSALDKDNVIPGIDVDTEAMLQSMSLGSLQRVKVMSGGGDRDREPRGDRKPRGDRNRS